MVNNAENKSFKLNLNKVSAFLSKFNSSLSLLAISIDSNVRFCQQKEIKIRFLVIEYDEAVVSSHRFNKRLLQVRYFYLARAKFYTQLTTETLRRAREPT